MRGIAVENAPNHAINPAHWSIGLRIVFRSISLYWIVYLALKHGMTYVRQGQEEYEAQMKEKQVKALKRKARLLGLEVVEKPAGSVPAATATPAQG